MTNKNVSKNSQVSKPRNRLFLVVADDSKELHQALYYAARRAATAGGEVALFRCIEPVEGQLWGGVTEIMEAEAEQASKNLLLELGEYCEKLGAPKPRTFVRKGILHEELFNLIDKDTFLKFPYFDGIHRFLPALFKGYGKKTLFIPVDHRLRIHGFSKYGTFKRLFKGILDLYKVYNLIKNSKNND